MTNKYNAVYNFYHGIFREVERNRAANGTKSNLLNAVSNEIAKLKNGIKDSSELSRMDKDKVTDMIAGLHGVMKQSSTTDIRSLGKSIHVATLKGVMQMEIKEDIENEIKIQLMEQAATKLK